MLNKYYHLLDRYNKNNEKKNILSQKFSVNQANNENRYIMQMKENVTIKSSNNNNLKDKLPTN